jgi:parallel beta-helix repeat protein
VTAFLTSAGVALLSATAAAQPSRPILLRPGMVITRSVRILPRLYRISAPASLDSAVVTIRGDDLTLDLGGATLQGLDPGADPDRADGVAIRIEGGRNVRVVNGRIRGYRVALLARGTRNLVLGNLDASYNWKPRLFSLIEHESLLDWLSFHHNEKNEWLRYGAGFYLDGVRGGEIRATISQQGMNGLLLVRSDSLRIQDNDFSFNSGLGIGLYRASHNTIVHNRLDYNVRGYSDRFYHRGQDSAGLLLYEQSSDNVVAWNSATHGGDGLFLWAGQSTMDTGEGGANDNVFYGNDFSFAPANAMEATFSRNSFIANRAEGSDYGLWGGYSYGSTVAGNCFLKNRTGLAIEHGQENRVTSNLFVGDTTAINLWADPIEPSDWGYPKHRDTRSRDYRVEENGFVGNRVAIRARNTAGLAVAGNRFAGVDSTAVLRDTSDYRFAGNQTASDSRPARSDPCDGVPPLAAEFARLAPSMPAPLRRAPSSPASRRDRSAIVVDQWGPFDWRSPKLWPVDSSRASPLRLRTLGPSGNWRVVGRQGIERVTPLQGRMGDTVVVTPAADSKADWELGLEFLGGAVRTPRGERVPAGRPSRFSYGRFEPRTEWSARFFAWGDSTDLVRDSLAFDAVSQQKPLLTRQLSRLDLEWYRPQLPGLPLERWALEATGTVVLPSGAYQLQTISDDGIRAWVDGRLVIDRWTQHESALDRVSLPAGRHELKVRFFQLDGWTELRVEILRLGAP